MALSEGPTGRGGEMQLRRRRGQVSSHVACPGRETCPSATRAARCVNVPGASPAPETAPLLPIPPSKLVAIPYLVSARDGHDDSPSWLCFVESQPLVCGILSRRPNLPEREQRRRLLLNRSLDVVEGERYLSNAQRASGRARPSRWKFVSSFADRWQKWRAGRRGRREFVW